MSDHEQRDPSEAGGRAVLAQQLDERWERVSPGIYRLREGAPPDPQAVEQARSAAPRKHPSADQCEQDVAAQAMPPQTSHSEGADKRVPPIFDEFEEAIDAALRIVASIKFSNETSCGLAARESCRRVETVR